MHSTPSGDFSIFFKAKLLLQEKLVFLLPDFIEPNMASKTFHSFDTRACSTFSNPLFFATVEIMLMPFAVYMFLNSESRKRRILGLFCLLLSFGGIAASYSRGPYLFSVMVFAILLLYSQ